MLGRADVEIDLVRGDYLGSDERECKTVQEQARTLDGLTTKNKHFGSVATYHYGC